MIDASSIPFASTSSWQFQGEAAARFVEAADEALEKRGSIDFSKQVAKARAILKRSKLYI